MRSVSILLLLLLGGSVWAQTPAPALSAAHAQFAGGRVALVPPAGWQAMADRGAANPASNAEFLMVLHFENPITLMAPSFREATPKDQIMSGQTWTTSYRAFNGYRAHVNLIEQRVGGMREGEPTQLGKSYMVLIEYERDKSFVSVGFNPVPNGDARQADKLAEMLRTIATIVVLEKK